MELDIIGHYMLDTQENLIPNHFQIATFESRTAITSNDASPCGALIQGVLLNLRLHQEETSACQHPLDLTLCGH